MGRNVKVDFGNIKTWLVIAAIAGGGYFLASKLITKATEPIKEMKEELTSKKEFKTLKKAATYYAAATIAQKAYQKMLKDAKDSGIM